mmetsp:Transcript_15577/g.49249  ORF Transcript_15577/g.49249 Transcript_15577/m.49249 type:complete len:529 (-) Transcript_15577:350-1936(-)
MLARGAAAKILPSHKDVGTAVGLLVEHEVGPLGLAVVLVAELEEGRRAQPRALDRLEELLGDDAVRVHVRFPQRRGRDTLELGELRHAAGRGAGRGGARAGSCRGLRRRQPQLLRAELPRVERSLRGRGARGLRQLGREGAHVLELARDGRGRGHRGAHEVRAALGALAALKVPVRRRGAALLGLQAVGVHAQAHGAAGLAPVEAGLAEDLVQALGLGLLLHEAGAGDDHGVDALGHLPAPDDACDAAEVLDAAVRAGADEDLVNADVLHLHPGLKAHVAERALHARALRRVLHVLGVGDAAGDGHDVLRARAPGDRGSDVHAVDGDVLVKDRALVGLQRLPVGERLLPGGSLRGQGPALEVGEGHLVRRHHARPRPGLDRHVADGHARLHGKGLDDVAAELDDVAGAAGGADDADDVEDHVLRVHAVGKLAAHLDAHVLLVLHHERLRRKHVLNFRGANAKRERTESPVRGGVAVAAHEGGARQREALLRPDDVDDALPVVVHAEEREPEGLDVILQGHDLRPRLQL